MCIETELQKFSVSFESFNGIIWNETDKNGCKKYMYTFFFDWVEKLSLLRGNVKNRKNTICYKKKTFMFVWLTLMYQTVEIVFIFAGQI